MLHSKRPTPLLLLKQISLTQSLHPAQIPVEKLLENCSVERTRRGGPGGQHRNKVESAIIVAHQPTGIIGQASERRSQHENRKVAIIRLRLNLAVGVRREIPGQMPPSDLWSSRTRGGRVSVSSEHDDFPALLAEALDFVSRDNFELAAAASSLSVTSSQLIKLFKMHRPALDYVNAQRFARNMGQLKWHFLGESGHLDIPKKMREPPAV